MTVSQMTREGLVCLYGGDGGGGGGGVEGGKGCGPVRGVKHDADGEDNRGHEMEPRRLLGACNRYGTGRMLSTCRNSSPAGLDLA